MTPASRAAGRASSELDRAAWPSDLEMSGWLYLKLLRNGKHLARLASQ